MNLNYRLTMATSVKPKICENGMLSDIWIKSPRRKIIIVHLAHIHILKMRNPINVRRE